MPLPYSYKAGNTPLIISIPHAGTYVPPRIMERMTDEARALPDTDWHVDKLYSFANPMGASILKGNYSRYVIDLNRPPDDTPLYPGTETTGLCPLTLFNGNPIYQAGQEPDRRDISKRIETIWAPYHQCLVETISEKVVTHGYALIYEAHSIQSVVPRLFEGRLPDLNLGTDDGASASHELQLCLYRICSNTERYSSTMNGRFKGGYITRYYGQPANDVHAVQLELTQCSYMNESPPYNYLPHAAADVRKVLQELIECLLEWQPA